MAPLIKSHGWRGGDGSLVVWGFGEMIDRNCMVTVWPFLYDYNHKYFILKKEPNHICHL